MKNTFAVREIIQSFREQIIPVFCSSGTLDEYQFLGATGTVYVFIWFSQLLENPLLSYVFCLLAFYPILIIIQKRCRDFNQNGTIFILAASIAMILGVGTYFVSSENNEFAGYIKKIAAISALFTCGLCFIPSKRITDKDVSSFLLKYPRIYAGMCCFLTVIITIYFN